MPYYGIIIDRTKINSDYQSGQFINVKYTLSKLLEKFTVVQDVLTRWQIWFKKVLDLPLL